MPGVGARSRFRVAAPGRLIVLEPSGSQRVLVDGAAPSPGSLGLIDVNAPDVSYDGRTIVFAGLPAGTYAQTPVNTPGAWRIYTINVDGTGLRQVTFTDQQVDMSQFGEAAQQLAAYDDTDPVWLPDGRIVFSSTRWPSFAQYSGVRTTNLHVVTAAGAGLTRITSERNGADRPLVDPQTGKVVYARWWRNHRFATDDLSMQSAPDGGFHRKDGLTTSRSNHVGGTTLFRNAWQLAAINPDGTDLVMWAGAFRNEAGNHAYGGAFTASGELLANFFPMYNMTEASGFGGIRRYRRGPGTYEPVIGVTELTLDYVHPANPTSFGIFNGIYASEPDVLSDGRLVFSLALDVGQDYGLYVAGANGRDPVELLDLPGTTELRARAVRARPLPPLIPDIVQRVPSLLPPAADGPYDTGGTFVFDAMNVYGNAPVDTDITSAPPVGSAAVIRFFIDHQRTSPGSFPSRDWPVLLGEQPVSAAGAVRHSAPADVPLFEQLRDSSGRVPETRGATGLTGAAHVTGMNFGRPGTAIRCIGCHAGHSMIPTPSRAEEALWSNLAPGAGIAVSSTRDANQNVGLTDRRVRKGEIWRYWTSRPGTGAGEWVKLTFPVPIAVRAVRLYNPRAGGEAHSSLVVQRAVVRLFLDAAATQEIGTRILGPLSVDGTIAEFDEVTARAVRVEIQDVTGTFYGARSAGLAEVEVIAKGLETIAAGSAPAVPTNLRVDYTP